MQGSGASLTGWAPPVLTKQGGFVRDESDDWGLSTFLPSDVTDKVPGEKLAVGGTDQNKEVTSVCEATLPATGILELYSLLPAQRAGDRCGRFPPALRTIRRPAGKMCKR